VVAVARFSLLPICSQKAFYAINLSLRVPIGPVFLSECKCASITEMDGCPSTNRSQHGYITLFTAIMAKALTFANSATSQKRRSCSSLLSRIFDAAGELHGLIL
jgi:hypothetical protein